MKIYIALPSINIEFFTETAENVLYVPSDLLASKGTTEFGI